MNVMQRNQSIINDPRTSPVLKVAVANDSHQGYIGEGARPFHYAPTISHDPRSPRSVDVAARNDELISFPVTTLPAATRTYRDDEHSLSDHEMSGIKGDEMGPISPGLLCELTQLTMDVSFEKECQDAGAGAVLKETANASSSASSTSSNSPKKATKKRKKRKKSKDSQHCGVSYFPTAPYRAQGNIQIAKQLTEQVIPERIAEAIPSVYAFMDKSTALAIASALRLEHNGSELLVLNYGFHDKRGGQALFCVAAQQDRSATASRGYALRMLNELFDAEALSTRFGIDAERLPKSFRETPVFAEKLRHGAAILRALQNDAERRRLIEETAWHKTAIFNKVNNKRRMTLSVTKPEFQREMTTQMKGMSEVQLVPMVMFAAEREAASGGSTSNDFWVEHVLVVALDEAVDVGIAFVVDGESQRVRVSGIHLDREFMRLNHELLFPGEPAAALSGFASAINYLSIGNPDDALNKIKYYQQQIQELSEKLHQKTVKANQQQQQRAVSAKAKVSQQQPAQPQPQQQQFVTYHVPATRHVQQRAQQRQPVQCQAMSRNMNVAGAYSAVPNAYAMGTALGHGVNVNRFNPNVMAQAQYAQAQAQAQARFNGYR